MVGAGLTLINPQYVEPPSPMSVLGKLPGKMVSLSAGFFFVNPQRNRGRKNVSLLSAWLASEVCKLPAAIEPCKVHADILVVGEPLS